jgi:hypothetical protein
MWSLGSFACAPAPEMTAVAEQALADGRATLAVLAMEVPPVPPALRQSARTQPLRPQALPALLHRPSLTPPRKPPTRLQPKQPRPPLTP